MYRIYTIKNGEKLYLMPDTVSFSGSSFGTWKEKSVQNVLKGLQNQKKNKGIKFFTEPVPESNGKKKKADLKELENTLSSITEFQKHKEDYRNQYLEIIKQEERAIIDIEHFIELNDYTDEDALKYVHQIKMHRKKRREAKDGLLLLETTDSLIAGKKGVKDVETLNKFLNSREYHPRVLKER